VSLILVPETVNHENLWMRVFLRYIPRQSYGRMGMVRERIPGLGIKTTGDCISEKYQEIKKMIFIEKKYSERAVRAARRT
jgi:hypothetical protein